jgi:peptide chain release factor 2
MTLAHVEAARSIRTVAEEIRSLAVIELEQLKVTLNSFREPLENLRGSLALDAKRDRVEQLELDMEAPGFWDDLETSQNVMKEVKGLKGILEEYEDLKGKFDDVETLIDMAEEEEDEDLVSEATQIMDEFQQEYERLHFSRC